MNPVSISSSLPNYFPRFWCKSGAPRILDDYSCLKVNKVCYRPPGTPFNLLNDVSLFLPMNRFPPAAGRCAAVAIQVLEEPRSQSAAKPREFRRDCSFGLVLGRSGSGKTTLLQILAGLSTPTSGSICIQQYGGDGSLKQSQNLLPERVGIVFQFPERYFLADTVLEEATFGWPRQKADIFTRGELASNLQYAFSAVDLHTISHEENPHALSGGFKRRLALAVQLVKKPALLLLDEPLAGIDWKARADVVKLLMHLKKELTILAVSHDLKELSALVDFSWRMEMGGKLKEEKLTL